jgi:hypothetical protein
MSADPSGAEMRSPNEVLSAKRIAELVSTLTDPETCDTYDKDALPDDTLAVCASHEALRSRLESEVSPRSSGATSDSLLCVRCGYPESLHAELRPLHPFQPFHDELPAPRSSGGAPLSVEQIADHVAYAASVVAPQPRNGSVARIYALCDSHEALRTQVSALRQEAAQAVANARVRRKYIDAAAAARQEAETLTRQRDAAIREISVIAREAETLRKQLEGLQKLNAENVKIGAGAQRVASASLAAFSEVSQAETASRAEIGRLTREAETLRGQLDAEKARLDFLSSWTRGDSGICPPGNHGGDPGTWLFFRQDDAKGDSYGLWNDVETEGPTLREAIDAARVAAPREPK